MRELLPGTGKQFVRRATEKASGREAVLKHVTYPENRRYQRRFWDQDS